MMTLTASPRTIKTPAPVAQPRRTEAARTAATPRPGFWRALLRALSAPSA